MLIVDGWRHLEVSSRNVQSFGIVTWHHLLQMCSDAFATVLECMWSTEHTGWRSLQTEFNDILRTEATNCNNFWEHSSYNWGKTINIDEKLTFKFFLHIFLLFLWCWQLLEHEHEPADVGMDREHSRESLADLALLFWWLCNELRDAFSYKSAL